MVKNIIFEETSSNLMMDLFSLWPIKRLTTEAVVHTVENERRHFYEF